MERSHIEKAVFLIRHRLKSMLLTTAIGMYPVSHQEVGLRVAHRALVSFFVFQYFFHIQKVIVSPSRV